MLVFKENVYGFVYDSQYDNVRTIFNRPLTQQEIDFSLEILGNDDCLLVDIEECNEMWKISCKEDLDDDEDGLNEVFDFID
jgi:hypothetical protein